jgi:hypothetical protein
MDLHLPSFSTPLRRVSLPKSATGLAQASFSLRFCDSREHISRAFNPAAAMAVLGPVFDPSVLSGFEVGVELVIDDGVYAFEGAHQLAILFAASAAWPAASGLSVAVRGPLASGISSIVTHPCSGPAIRRLSAATLRLAPRSAE